MRVSAKISYPHSAEGATRAPSVTAGSRDAVSAPGILSTNNVYHTVLE